MKKKTLREHCEEEIEWAQERIRTDPDKPDPDKPDLPPGNKWHLGWHQAWIDAHEQIKELYAD